MMPSINENDTFINNNLKNLTWVPTLMWSNCCKLQILTAVGAGLLSYYLWRYKRGREATDELELITDEIGRYILEKRDPRQLLRERIDELTARANELGVYDVRKEKYLRYVHEVLKPNLLDADALHHFWRTDEEGIQLLAKLQMK